MRVAIQETCSLGIPILQALLSTCIGIWVLFPPARMDAETIDTSVPLTTAKLWEAGSPRLPHPTTSGHSQVDRRANRQTCLKALAHRQTCACINAHGHSSAINLHNAVTY